MCFNVFLSSENDTPLKVWSEILPLLNALAKLPLGLVELGFHQ